MKKWTSIALMIFLTAISLIGCASGSGISFEESQEMQPMPFEYGEICVFRPRKGTDSLAKYRIIVDGRKDLKQKLLNGSYIRYFVQPGTHLIKGNIIGHKLEVDVQAGETVYVEAAVTFFGIGKAYSMDIVDIRDEKVMEDFLEIEEAAGPVFVD